MKKTIKADCNEIWNEEKQIWELLKQDIIFRPKKKDSRIYQYDKQFNLIEVFENQSIAQRNFTREGNGGIAKCLGGAAKTAYGFIWTRKPILNKNIDTESNQPIYMIYPNGDFKEYASYNQIIEEYDCKDDSLIRHLMGFTETFKYNKFTYNKPQVK
jgi:hypothetical protein